MRRSHRGSRPPNRGSRPPKRIARAWFQQRLVCVLHALTIRIRFRLVLCRRTRRVFLLRVTYSFPNPDHKALVFISDLDRTVRRPRHSAFVDLGFCERNTRDGVPLRSFSFPELLSQSHFRNWANRFRDPRTCNEDHNNGQCNRQGSRKFTAKPTVLSPSGPRCLPAVPAVAPRPETKPALKA